MNILIIDGQGGGVGRTVIEALKRSFPSLKLTALGTNSIATSAMLRAGADYGATGENPIVFNCKSADVIIGPIGIIAANSLMGELTPAMALAVGDSRAYKILIPSSKCSIFVAGTRDLQLQGYVDAAVAELSSIINNASSGGC